MIRALLDALKRLFFPGSSRPQVHERLVSARRRSNGKLTRTTAPPRARCKASRSGVVAVLPDARPYWVLRGWREAEGKLVGAFRTPRGSFVGRIEFDRFGNPSFYVLKPPKAALKSGHGPCFRLRRQGWYWIHFSVGRDVDGGIAAVEQIISRALGC